MLLRQKNPEVATEISMEFGEDVHLYEEKVRLEADLSALEKCIDRLGQDQKKCVIQFFLERKSYQEIHQISGLDMKKIKSHIQNGKRNLKICLEANNVA